MQRPTTRGRRLREARERAGLSQRALGEAAGYDQALVSRVERGLQRPSVDYLRAVAQILDLWAVVDVIDQVWQPAEEQTW